MSLIENLFSAIHSHLSNDNIISYVATGAAVTASGYLLRQVLGGRREPAGPPRVPYTIPFIGHTLELNKNPRKFLKECNAKYGETYFIHVLGAETLVTQGKLGYEVMRADSDLSMEGTLRDILHLDKLLPEEVFGFKDINAASMRIYYTPNRLHKHTEDIQIAAKEALDDLFGYLPEPKKLDIPHKTLHRIIARISARLFIGPEHNQEVVDSMALFTGDVMKAAGVLTMTPSFLRKTALKYTTNIPHHHQVMRKHVKPIIEERMRQKNDDAYIKKEDYIEWMMEWENEFPDLTADHNSKGACGSRVLNLFISLFPTLLFPIKLALWPLMQSFASINSTSASCAWAINWMVARPDVYEVLMREIGELLPNDDDVITHEIVLQMDHMDAFLREVLRHGAENLGLRKVAMRDYVFSDGTLLKKGKVVCVQELQLNFLKKNADGTMTYEDTFDPWRTMHQKTKNSVNGAADHVIFGLGKHQAKLHGRSENHSKHMCPGRYLAVYVMKIVLTYLLKRYKFQTVNGAAPVRPVDYLWGMIAIPMIQPLEFSNRK
ncbi:cytochrome P450 [Endogone sp. FLAS-F59071]|nr:cytochrome P450 [Endogone sp. FLAS-F59071]|eukprot:RUS15475.1 cytochrome P450 [Endogone sp. FLAS-F59071]